MGRGSAVWGSQHPVANLTCLCSHHSQVALLDFGATREFDKSFTDLYIQVGVGRAWPCCLRQGWVWGQGGRRGGW